MIFVAVDVVDVVVIRTDDAAVVIVAVGIAMWP